MASAAPRMMRDDGLPLFAVRAHEVLASREPHRSMRELIRSPEVLGKLVNDFLADPSLR